MNVINKKNRLLLLMALSISGFIQLVSAQSGGDYKITKSSIDAGGGQTQGGDYKINSTIGQVDASAEISGGIYNITGGYWTNSGNDLIFKDDFE